MAAVIVRRATEADLAAVRELWQELEAEVPAPGYLGETWEEEGLEERVRAGDVFLAEEDGAVLAFADLKVETRRLAWLHTIHVRPEARSRGVAKALLREVALAARARGADHLGLEVLTTNGGARAVYERLGFAEYARQLATRLDDLEQRLGREEPAPSHGAVYVQTDDRAAVDRAVHRFLPRLGRTEGTEVLEPLNGWTCVRDELCSREPSLLRRLARELSDRTGAVVLSLGVEEGAVVRYVLFDRGRVADEYASLPEYHGPLPPGDVVALSANPTVVARLTGADPARLRAVARTASSPAELPPAGELLAQLGVVLGVGRG